MATLFEVLASRVRALLLVDAGLDLEAEFLAREARRRAELLRQAVAYEGEGLTEVAQELRSQAGAVDVQKPLQTAALALRNLQNGAAPRQLPNDTDATCERNKSDGADREDNEAPKAEFASPATATGRKRKAAPTS
jgi:hypothetical protein